MKVISLFTASQCMAVALCNAVMAQDARPKSFVLITNANVFDGKSETLATGMSVLIKGNKIAKIGKSIAAPAGATSIDAKGRTLSPGFIDVLLARGYKKEDIAKIWGGNGVQVMRAVVG